MRGRHAIGRYYDVVRCARTGKVLSRQQGRNKVLVGGVCFPLLQLAGLQSDPYPLTHWAFGAGSAGWGGGDPPASAYAPPDLTRLVDERSRVSLDYPPPDPTTVVRRFIRELPEDYALECGEGTTTTVIEDRDGTTPDKPATRFEPDGWWDGATIQYYVGGAWVSDVVAAYTAPDPGAGTPAQFSLATGHASLAEGVPYKVDRTLVPLGSTAGEGTTTTLIVDPNRTQATGAFDGDFLEVEVSPGIWQGVLVTSYVNPGPSGSPEFTLAGAVTGLAQYSTYRLPGRDLSNQVEFVTFITGPSVAYNLREMGLVIRGQDGSNTGVLYNTIRHAPISFDDTVIVERRLVLDFPFE